MRKILWQRLLRLLGFGKDPWTENRMELLQALFEDLNCTPLENNTYHYQHPWLKGEILFRIESNAEVVIEHFSVDDLRALLGNRLGRSR